MGDEWDGGRHARSDLRRGGSRRPNSLWQRGPFRRGRGGLWETDGSSGGTHELAGTAGLNPFDLTVFGSEVLFASSTGGLWETNGAVGSTPTKIASVTPLDMVVYNGGVLFSGFDGAGVGLWETNGARQHPDGDQRHFGARSSNMTVYNGEVLFNGVDAGPRARVVGVERNQRDGTRPGDRPIQLRNLQRSCAVQRLGFEWPCSVVGDQWPGRRHERSGRRRVRAGLAPFDLTAVVTGFVSNPDLDIILQNTSGQLALWQTDGATLSAAILLGPNPGPSWSEEATGAFFSGDTSDILWQNTSGAVAVWQMQNDALVWADAVANPGPNWHVVGTGDLYNDGHTDVLVRNDNGTVGVWDMNGSTISRAAATLTPARIGRWSGLATFTVTAIPMCWSGTTTARSGSGT